MDTHDQNAKSDGNATADGKHEDPKSKKSTINRIGNYILYLAAVYAVVVLAQRWFLKDPRTGAEAKSFQAVTVNGGHQSIPTGDAKPSVLVFWATWCGPCKIELSRLQSAIQEGRLPAKRVFAISVGEDPEDVFRFAKDEGYTFQVLADTEGSSGNLYSVRATPTVFHLDDQDRIAWTAEGLHPLSVRKAVSHLQSEIDSTQ